MPTAKQVVMSQEDIAATNAQMGTDLVLKAEDLAKMDEIIELSTKVDVKRVGEEILDWLIANVEEYVDNAETIYRIYFKPEVISGYAEAGKLQKLYQDIPETGHQKEVDCIDKLHEVVERVKQAILADKDRMQKLFERLVFFYDTKFSSVNGQLVPVTIPMEGEIAIHEFIFDTVGQTVQVMRKNVELTRDQMQSPDAMALVKKAIAGGKYQEVVTEINQPQGFSLEMEISYWPKTV